MANGSKTVVLKPQGVTFEDVINVARFNAKVEISDEAKAAIDKSRKYIDEYTQGGKAIYGVSTGFSLIANFKLLSIAIGVIRVTVILASSPGIIISTPAGNKTSPVTSVVLK